MVSVFADRGYRTGLGTAFYDRVDEVRTLDRLSRCFTTVVVYGPRNVGKSELVRYWLRRRGVDAVAVDARLARDREVLRSLGIEVGGGVAGALERVVGAVVGALEGLGLAGLVVRIAEALAEAVAALRRPLYVVVDEFHMLPRCGSPREALRDLEAAAATIAKGVGGEGIRLVVTVSEGFVATAEARQRLFGYSTAWMLIEPMDTTHFTELYREYRELYGCRQSLETVLRLVGTSPGYLRELCALDDEALKHFVETVLRNLETALTAAIRELGLEPHTAMETALEAMKRGAKPMHQPQLAKLGEILTQHNITYPKHKQDRVVYKPQIPAYQRALEKTLEKRLDTPTQLDPRELIQ